MSGRFCALGRRLRRQPGSLCCRPDDDGGRATPSYNATAHGQALSVSPPVVGASHQQLPIGRTMSLDRVPVILFCVFITRDIYLAGGWPLASTRWSSGRSAGSSIAGLTSCNLGVARAGCR